MSLIPFSPKPVRSLPSLEDFLDELRVPEDAVICGMCDDGLPWALGIDDMPLPTVLIEGGRSILETIARSVNLLGVRRVETVVLSNDWSLPGKIVSPFYSSSTDDILHSLASWAHGNYGRKRELVLVDGMERIFDLDFDTRQNLRWLLIQGIRRGVCVIASYGKMTHDIHVWLDAFKVRVRSEGDHWVVPEAKRETRVYAL